MSFWVLMSALQVLSMEQLAFLSACSLTHRMAEGRGWVQWSIVVKNLQVSSCLASGNAEINRMLLVLAAGWCAGSFLGLI